MKKFSDLGVKTELQETLTGDKIKMHKVLNRSITVHNFRIEPSKFTGQCLYMQIEMDGEKRVVFTGSVGLLQVIQKIPKTDFPFTTTIVKENDRYEFT